MAVFEVQHSQNLSKDFEALLLDKEYSDITLIVENEQFHCHKIILATRSSYFRSLLSRMQTSEVFQIQLKVPSLAAFNVVLQYIYSGQISLTNPQLDSIWDIFKMARMYKCHDLRTAILEYLQTDLNTDNVCSIYDKAYHFQLDGLVTLCSTFMNNHSLEIISHESFLTLSPTALNQLISRNSFCVPEVDLFKAICSWIEHNPKCDLQPILQAVRLPLMTHEQLVDVVRPTGHFTSDQILDAIRAQLRSCEVDLQYRGRCLEDENVVSNEHNAEVIQGENQCALLNNDNCEFETDVMQHPLDSNDGQGIVIKLGTEYIVNHVKLLLWDKDGRSYSYYVEMSVDGKHWLRIVDYSKYLCRSWQNLYFVPRVARYIRIVGTNNTVNRTFHLVSIIAMFASNPLQVEDCVVVPRDNTEYVSIIAPNARVIKSDDEKYRNGFLNGDNQKMYDGGSGYVSHNLPDGAIVIQLAQPFLLDSMRLLLWDLEEDRKYSYYIEVSTDYDKWDLLMDKRNEQCSSWQTLRFPKTMVVFIRIIGTENNAFPVFHCVHFECPAKDDAEEASRHNGS